MAFEAAGQHSAAQRGERMMRREGLVGGGQGPWHRDQGVTMPYTRTGHKGQAP